MDRGNALVLAALALIVIGAILLSANTVLGPNGELEGTDDFIILNNSHKLLLNGFNYGKLNSTTFSVSYLFEGVPAFSMALLGANLVTESSLGIISLVVMLVAVFEIGRLQKDALAGLFASATLALIPLVASEGATPGDSAPVAALAALAVLMLVLGMKSGKDKFYLLSGFIAVAGALAGSAEIFFVLIFLLPVLGYMLYKDRSHEQAGRSASFVTGAVLGLMLICVLGALLQGDAFVYFAKTFGSKLYPNSAQPQLPVLMAQLFPTNASYLSDSLHFALFNFDSISHTNRKLFLFGLFGYLAALSGAYLIARKKRYANLAIAWPLLLLLGLGFGKSDPLSPFFLLMRTRFMLIMAPPVAVLVGLCISELFEQSRAKPEEGKPNGRAKMIALAVLAVAVIAYLFAAVNAIATMGLMHKVVYLDLYPWIQTASLIPSLRNNTPIYVVSGLSRLPGPASFNPNNTYGEKTLQAYLTASNQVTWLSIEVYSGFRANVNYQSIFADCTSLPQAGYFIEVNVTPADYPNNLLGCGLRTVFVPDPRTVLTDIKGVVHPAYYAILTNIQPA